jgi:hypothetical protein
MGVIGVEGLGVAPAALISAAGVAAALSFFAAAPFCGEDC